jgi:ABC-type branched-subunit amino acid transport system permease subunit
VVVISITEGLGTLFGPVLGAVVVILLRDVPVSTYFIKRTLKYGLMRKDGFNFFPVLSIVLVGKIE